MSRIIIVHFSRTGNTEAMARAVAEGAKAVHGTEVVLSKYFVPAEEIAGCDALLVGVPTYEASMPEGAKKFLEGLTEKDINLKDKVGAAFGSYGWSGEAPQLVLDFLKNRLGMRVTAPLLIREEPDQIGLAECREFGNEVAERLQGKIGE